MAKLMNFLHALLRTPSFLRRSFFAGPKTQVFVADAVPTSSKPGRKMAALTLLLSWVVFPSVGSAQDSQLPLVSPVLTYSGTVHSGTTHLTETGSVTVSATMDKAATDTVTVTISVVPANYNAPREFATEDDYVVSENKVLTFVPGSLASTGTVTITGVDDGGVKKHLRRIRINYTTSSNARTDRRGQPIAFEEFFIADDEPHPTKSVVVIPTTISENGGVATVTAKLSHPTLFGDVKLDVQTGLYPEGTPSRADSSDFMLSDNVRLLISKGDTLSTGTVTITAVDDDVVGSALKRMGARLHNVERGTVTTEPGLYSAWEILSIEEDDKPTVSLSVSPNPVDEGQSVTVTTELSAAIADDVTIPLVLTAGTAESGDYGTLASITITGGGTTETGTITTADDADRDDETFTVALGTLPTAVTPGTPSSVDVTIKDDDAQPPGLVVEPMSLTVAEGSRKSGSYTVKLATEPSATVTVAITGQSGTDLTLASFTPLLTFTTTTWNVAQTVTVLAGHDDDTSNDEETLVHTASGGGYDSLTANVMVTVIDDDEVALLVDPTSLTVAEGVSGSYTVKLATEPSATVTVAITGHAGTDLTLGATSLTFNPSGSNLWSTAQTVTVSAGEDDDTSNDAATLVHTASGGGYDSETANVAVTVTDDDAPALVVDPASLTVAEGGSGSYTVKLATQPTATVTVAITGQAGTDLTLGATSLTFNPSGSNLWSTAQTVTVSAGHDDDTSNDAATLVHTASGGGYDSETANVAVTVTDDDAPALVVDPASLTVAEGGSRSYTVRLATEPSATVTVAITGHAGTDLTLGATSLTFNPSGSNLWSTAQTVTVSAGQDDDTSNDTETLVNTASGGGYDSETANVAVTVIDDDPATRTVSLSVTPNPVDEGNSATVTAWLSGTLPSGVTIPLTLTPGTAESGDYGTLAGITITGGETTATGTITTIVDADADDETFTVALGTLPSAVTPGTPSSVEVTIKDHDAPALVVDPTSLTVAEGGSRSYTVRLATEPSATVTVAITGHAGTDLTLGATSLTFNPSGSNLWSTAQTVTVSAGQDDDTSNDTETLVNTASGGGYDSETANVAVTVIDDDPATRTVSLSVTPNPVDEGNSATVTARLSGTLPNGVTIPLTLTPGTAESGDYGTLAGITITGGETTATGTITTIDDADADDETFTVALGTLPSAVTPGTPSSVEVTIKDHDAPALVVDPTSLTVAEGGSRSYTVRLATEPSATVTVAITGHAGTDLTLGATSLTFNPSGSNLWSTAQTVTVSAGQDDDTSNDTETLVNTASGGGYGSESANVEVRVIDDDPATRTVSLSVTPNPVDEGNSATVTAWLSGTLPSGVTIPLTLTPGTAESGDYGTLAGITITGGETTATGTITTIVDADADDETFTVALGTLPSAVTPGTPSSVEVTIKDHDAPALVVDPTSLTVAEGGSRSYTVRLATEPSATVTVAITGHAGTDLTLGATSLTFNPSGSNLWSTAQTVTVSAGQDDDTSNDTETLVNTASGGGYGSESANVEVRVIDDDPATRTVSLSVTPNPVDEGNSATVTAWLSGTLPNRVTVPLTLTAGTAESGDYGSLAGITVNGGDATGTGMVTTVKDADEDDETFTVALGVLPDGLVPGSPSSIEVTIRDLTPPPPPSNRPPTVTASCDPCSVPRGGEVRLEAKATDPDGDPLTYAWSAPRGGFSGTDEPVAHWTAPAKLGMVAIRVEVSDGRGGSASAVVEVEVVNRASMFGQPSYSFELPENLDGRIRPIDLGTVSAVDPDGDVLTYEIASGDSERFTIGALDGVVRYIGTGEDFETEPNLYKLTVRVRDGFGAEDTVRVVVVVTDVNELPEVTAACDPCSVPRGGEVVLTATATDPDGDPLTYAWSAPTGGFSGADAPVARWTAPAELGTVAIRVKVSDGRGGSASTVLEVEVVNRASMFGQPSYGFELPENVNGRDRPVDLGQVSAVDPDGDALTYELASGDSKRFTIGALDGVVRYIGPGEDYETEPNLYELTVRVRDGFGAEDTARVVVTVTDVNELPEVTAACDPCSVPRGGEVGLTATATDPDGDPFKYAWSAEKGSFSGTGEPVARWTAPAELGMVEIRIKVSDGRGGSASDVVAVEVVNRAPVFGQPSYSFELPENVDGRDRPGDLGQVSATDPDGDALTYEIASGDRDRFAVGARDGVVRYVGAGEDFEMAPNRFELVLRTLDGFGGEAHTEVAIEVTDVNEAPEATDDEAVTDEDKAVTVDVLANDTDPEGNRLHVLSVTAAVHGTVRLVSGDRVIYTPETNFHGTDSFTYVASDERGLTDTASVEVTVLPVNDAPTAVGTIPNQTLDEGGGAVHMDLSPFFDDVDGDALTYGAQSSNTGVVLAEVTGTVLALTPVLYGPATVTVTAWDPEGLSATQSLRVGVSDHPQRAILDNLLAATARGHLASLRAALGRRMAAGPCEASRLEVLGRSVPLGRTEAAALLGQIGTGARSAAVAALRLREGVGGPGGAISLPTGPGVLSAAKVLEKTDREEAALRSMPARVLGVGGASGSGAADFLLAWGGSEEDRERCQVRGRWSLWGQGDVQWFDGTPSVYGYDAYYDGELSTAYVGLDTRLGARWLAGVAISRSRSVGDWRAGTSVGRLTQFMTAVHPYLGWTGGSTSVWASAGAGRGDARNVRAAGRTGTSPTSLRLGLFELERRLGAPGGIDFNIMADAAWARLWTGKGEETIDDQDIAVNQVRIGTDLSLPARIGGAELTPFGTVHARRDGGSGQTGDGIEVAGGLRAVLGIVRLDAQARMLIHHLAEGYGERGAAVTLALGKQGSDEGFSLSVSPRWGDPAHASGAFLHGPLDRGIRGDGPESHRWTLDAHASYVVTLPGGLRLDLQGSYGSAFAGPGFGLRVGRSATAIRPHRVISPSRYSSY